MKALLCGLLSLSALTGLQAATAYEALRVVGKVKGDATLDQVVEVRGTKGAPIPRYWKVIVLDAKGRGGIRELDVHGNSIAEERPAENGDAAPMNMNALNLDSDGAHTVAEREAKRAGFAYDYVNYSLRGGSQGGSPVWELRLVDERNGSAAVLTVGADSGKLIATQGLEKGTAPVPRVAENRRPPVVAEDEEGVEMIPGEEDEEIYIEERRIEERRREPEEVDRHGNKVTRFFDRAGRHIGGAFQRFGDKLDRAFGSPPPRRTQRRTAPPPPTRQRQSDNNGTEYYRPRD
jgi:hypothetical protein